MRATAGAQQMTEARAGVETRKDQVQHVRGGYMPGRGPQGRSVLVTVNLSSASLREDLNPRRQESSGKTSRSNRGRFCESLERISQRGSKATERR